MKVRFHLVAVLAFALPLSSQTNIDRLEGCPDPMKVAEGLAKVRQSDWDEIDAARIKGIWPVPLGGADCDSTACSSIESRSRIISDHYECSDMFFFDVERNADSTPREILKNFIIHYSTSRKRSTITAAKMMVRALGLPERELATVGNDSSHLFDWQDKSKTELSGLGLEFSHRGIVWTVTLRFSRFPVPPGWEGATK
jgi:hypothetical protein